MKRAVLVFAHPDDESFSSGGTIVKYVQSGWEVYLMCATRGEAGDNGPYTGASGEFLGNIRQKELEAAGTVLGVSAITFLGYNDGALSGLTPGELEDKIHHHIRALAPDVVITFEPNGISNHPDHKKISLSTTYAFQKYAEDRAIDMGQIIIPQGQRDHRAFVETEEKIKEPKLYYAAMPESVASHLKKQKNIPSEAFGKPWNGTPDKFITTVIDIRKVKNKKIKALQYHKTQKADVDRMLSLIDHPLLDKEYYILRMQGLYEVFMGKTDRVSDRL